eukprot:COSAG06_NODE_5140_length_3687_cov_1.862876_2_plen_60_part_00
MYPMGNAIFLSFPFVCPEPVLAKWCILYKERRKNGVSDLAADEFAVTYVNFRMFSHRHS